MQQLLLYIKSIVKRMSCAMVNSGQVILTNHRNTDARGKLILPFVGSPRTVDVRQPFSLGSRHLDYIRPLVPVGLALTMTSIAWQNPQGLSVNWQVQFVNKDGV